MSRITGTLINYYIHCKRQCWLAGNYITLEDNSELVKIGKALHEEKLQNSENTEISIDHIKVDKLTKQYLTEIKKSDADEEAVKWQVAYYLKVLKEKGLYRTGKINFIEKNKKNTRTIYIELDDQTETQVLLLIKECSNLIKEKQPPAMPTKLMKKCKECAYLHYCIV